MMTTVGVLLDSPFVATMFSPHVKLVMLVSMILALALHKKSLRQRSFCRVGTEPSAVAPGQVQATRPQGSLTRRYRARFCAYSAESGWSRKNSCPDHGESRSEYQTTRRRINLRFTTS